jgi:hypothetical protein
VRSQHADSGRKGKAVEHLVAALCVLGSDGELNAWTGLVDDEGVDLVLQRRERPETLAVQVKSRFTTAKGLSQRQQFMTQVRQATLRPRPDLYMLFVVADPVGLDIGPIWLIPSEEFVAISPPKANEKHKFVASAKPETKDQWSSYLIAKQDLPAHLVRVLETLSPG